MRIIGLALAVSTLALAQTPSYVVSPFPQVSGLGLVAMNNRGQAVGHLNSLRQAVVATPAGITPVPLPSGWTAAAAGGINDLGWISGTIGNGTISEAFIGTSQGITPIPLLEGWEFANGFQINNSGIVTGYAQVPNAELPFIAIGTHVVPLPVPSGGYYITTPYSINDFGEVAGWAVNSTTGQPYVGNIFKATAVPLPTGWTSSVACSINNRGQIAGFGYNNGQEMPFIGNKNGFAPIPLPPGATQAGLLNFSVNALNDLGQVVGWSDVGAWVWDSSHGTRLLNSLISAGPNLQSGVGINNLGQILAQDTSGNYYLLSPIR